MKRTGVITPHFTWEEAQCRCGCDMPESIAAEVLITAGWLEHVRSELGNVPMFITSWYRCEEYNKRVGGVPTSFHLLGQAVDFVQKEPSPGMVQHALLRLWPKLVKGLGRYAGFTHIDRRSGEAQMWGG